MKHNLLDTPLPSNNDAEQLVLGSIILDNNCGEQAFNVLVPADFYNPIHRTVYQAMLELYQQGQEIHPISINENLKSHGTDAGAFGGAATITNLTFGLPYLESIAEHVSLVKRHSVARDAIRLFNARTQEILEGSEPIEEILERSESGLLSLSTKVHAESKTDENKGFWTLGDIAPTLDKQFRDLHAGITVACPTGMKELDDMLDGGGLQPGGVYIVGASEKAGKTSLALDWAVHGAVVENCLVPIVTLEMSKENLAKRLFSGYTGIPYYMFRPGFYDSPTDNSYTRALEGLKSFAEIPIVIADRLFGMAEIARNLRRVCEVGQKIGKPVKYAVIDYLQLIEAGLGSSQSSREREVSSISRALKKLASELSIAIVVMSSLNRDGLKEGQEPTAFNLRDSQALAFDCEALIMLHNPAYVPGKPYEPQPITDMTMILSRQRNGPTGRIPMKFIGPYMQFMTESQFRKHNKGGDLPHTVGQQIEKETEMDKLWDTPDEESKVLKSKQGDDVPWD